MADVQSGGGHANYRTVQGGNLRVTMEAGRIVVTDPNGRSSTVAHADVASSNGVFHVTEAVLLPSSSTGCRAADGRRSVHRLVPPASRSLRQKGARSLTDLAR